ncbi:MAG: helix-turn-helix domain-containing protein [Chloroflexota bacterium]
MSVTDKTAPDYIPTEAEMIEAFQPIRFYALATNLYHLTDSGMLDDLLTHGPTTAVAISERLGMDAQRVTEFLKYLRNEGYIEQNDNHFDLSAKGKAFRHHHSIYTFIIGGYGESLAQIGEKLQKDSGWVSRNWTKISIGSSDNARYDTPPVLRRLMTHVPGNSYRLLDISCGNGGYLIDLCDAMPEIELAYGVDPSAESCAAAREAIAAKGLQDRIQIINSTNDELLDEGAESGVDIEPNLLILGYVLHDLLTEDGRNGVKRFLTQFTDRFDGLNLIVMEIDDQRDAPGFVDHDYALAFYNYYYLLHGFIDQEVKQSSFWEEIFVEARLEIVAKEGIDSTGWLPCYLLRKGGA